MPEIKPFSPDEARANKIFVLPPQLIQAVNELLSERYVDRGEIHMKLKDVKERVKQIFRAENTSDTAIGYDPTRGWSEKGYWDFEPVYRQQGWHVSYDGPAYNESYDGYYIFKKDKS